MTNYIIPPKEDDELEITLDGDDEDLADEKEAEDVD